MATDRTIYGPPITWVRREGASTSSRTSRYPPPIGKVYFPNKASGNFTIFPDGSRFRLPTAYNKRTVMITLGSPQKTLGRKPNGDQVSYDFTPGGNYDSLLTSLSPKVSSKRVSNFQLANLTPTMPVEMRNQAVTRALLDIADAKAGLGEDLATFSQTLQMLREPSQALATSLKRFWNDKSLRPYLRMSLAELRRDGISKKIASKYLEYVYGWKPLMSDIYEIHKMMKDTSQRPLLISGKGLVKESGQTNVGTSYDITNDIRWSLGPLSENTRVICKIWGRIDPAYAGLRALNQLGLINPASLAWELVPWSFVVDWFVPIGSVLQALTAPVGLLFVSGTVSVKTVYRGPYEVHYAGFDKYSANTQNATGTVSWEGWSRSKLNDWPLPGFWASANPFIKDRPYKALALSIVNLRSLRLP